MLDLQDVGRVVFSALLAVEGGDHARHRQQAFRRVITFLVSRLPLPDPRPGWVLRVPPLPELRRQVPLLFSEMRRCPLLHTSAPGPLPQSKI
eukprot:598913-Pleurochrysis_carterae.AAC.2